MEINPLEGTSDPTPSPSPGPPPTPPPPKPRGWQVPLDPPPQASKALADYTVRIRRVFQLLANTLGNPQYAVPPPVPPPVPPVAPPAQPADKASNLTGFTAASYSTSQNILQGHSAAWHDADGTTLTTAQQASTVGLTALRQIKDLVYRLQDMLNAANLVRTVPASYTEHSSAGSSLASSAEYKLAIAMQRTLDQAVEIVGRAQADLGLEQIQPAYPVFPTVPESVVPPQPIPMPELQPPPPNQGTLEV